jgi:hypothetical protein
MDQTRNQPMKSYKFTALAVSLLLVAAQFAAMYYDSRHRVADYRGEIATALPAHR